MLRFRPKPHRLRPTSRSLSPRNARPAVRADRVVAVAVGAAAVTVAVAVAGATIVVVAVAATMTVARS